MPTAEEVRQALSREFVPAKRRGPITTACPWLCRAGAPARRQAKILWFRGPRPRRSRLLAGPGRLQLKSTSGIPNCRGSHRVNSGIRRGSRSATSGAESSQGRIAMVGTLDRQAFAIRDKHEQHHAERRVATARSSDLRRHHHTEMHGMNAHFEDDRPSTPATRMLIEANRLEEAADDQQQHV